MHARSLLSGAVLLLVVAACGGDSDGPKSSSGPKSFSDAKALAKTLGCESSFESRDQDIAFPTLQKAYGKCTVNGNDTFLTVYFKSGDPDRMLDQAVASDGLSNWVIGKTWTVDVPDAKPGDMKKLKDKVGDSTATVNEVKLNVKNR